MSHTVARHVRVCAAEELPAGQVCVVSTPDRRVAVFNVDGEFYAIDDRCSHQQANLSDGWVDGCLVECPLHSSFFDLRTGKPTGPPARTPVGVYPVRVVDGAVYVEIVTGGGG